MVETVRGPVEVADLGTTLMHEHVFVLTPDLLANYGHEYWDEELRVADAIDKLSRLRDLGVRTIVDPTVVGLGRYVPRVARVNAEVDLHIVVATGLYTFDELPRSLQNRGPGTLLGGEEPLTGMFLRDIHEGIGGTGVKAALLKGVVEEKGLTRTRSHPPRDRGHPPRDRGPDHGAHQQRARDRPARPGPVRCGPPRRTGTTSTSAGTCSPRCARPASPRSRSRR